MADANYTRIKVQRIVNRVRRLMDQIPFVGEGTESDSHVTGSPTTRFSDSELIELINDGVRAIVQAARASHVYDQIHEDSSLSPTRPVVRLLRNRVFRNTVRARRQLVDTFRRLLESGRQPSDSFPVYSYEAGELNVAPSAGTLSWFYVTIPEPLDSSDPTTSLATDLPIDERFECALVYFVASLAYQKLQREDFHEMTYQIFLDEMGPYSPGTVTGVLKEREVETE